MLSPKRQRTAVLAIAVLLIASLVLSLLALVIGG